MTKLDDIRLTLPGQPGVYRFYDEAQHILYVGKARHLKRRVNSYFQRELANPRLRLLVSRIARIEITQTASEAEALLLESNLIKQHRPPFNIVFRDDKSYPYLQLSDHEFPRLTYFRGNPQGKHHYFGPYPHAHAAREMIQILQKILSLRTCEDSVFKHRMRPCLMHQIGRCSAPCVGLIDAPTYGAGVEQAVAILQGKTMTLHAQWVERMNQAAQRLAYEEAAHWRDRLAMIQSLLTAQHMSTDCHDDVDILCLIREQGELVLNLTMIRQGRHCGDRNLYPEHVSDVSDKDILVAFLSHHYGEHPSVPHIVANLPSPGAALLAWLAERGGQSVRWIDQPRGMQRAWLEGAERNAYGGLAQRRGQQKNQAHRLHALQEALALPHAPVRIECFDISHHLGSATVASCVVFEQGKPLKSAYRRYAIDGIQAGDDYAAMTQALERRFRTSRDGGVLPDLLLIDGGLGQLNVAHHVLQSYGLVLPLISIAKGPERKVGDETIHIQGRPEPLRLASHHAGFHLMLAIRDEAHRFAVAGHHARQRRERAQEPWQDIPGVGEKRQRRLLEMLGGRRALAQAAEADIAKVSGIGPRLAHAIFVALHGERNG